MRFSWKLILACLAIILTSQAQEDAPKKPKKATTPDPYVQDWSTLYAAGSRRLDNFNFEALRRGVRDLMKSFPAQYPKGEEYLRRADAYEKRKPEILAALKKRQGSALDEVDALFALQREALLANPLLDFDRILVMRRKPLGDARRSEAPNFSFGEFLGLPRQSSWQVHAIPNVFGWENEIAVLSGIRKEPELKTLFRPSSRRLVSDVDLHWDADRMLFSMPNDKGLWQVWEIGADGARLRQVTPGDQPDVHNYDAVYLPNGKIDFISTAPMQGVPCNSGLTVGMTYQMDAEGKNIRQISFDQDHNYNPTVMNDGRVMYLRWEYTDIPHVWARYLFSMNPDGTDQRVYYGSGGYWPNSTFYARPIPGHPTKVVGVITGHHVGRVGELIIFDPAKSRKKELGVVQRIPGYGKKVEPLVQDQLTINSYPKFLHPYPLSENYFLVSAKPTKDDLWGIYLVDVFDNMTLIKEVEGQALLEPIAFRKTTKPPMIPERVDLKREDALVYVSNVYDGPGLAGVPQGSVKKLRLFTYHFAYQHLAGINHRVGADGPWEPKQILGTVPVEKDGSAFFRVPAKTPISIQPLDERGRAVQIMRSWLTAQPGEFVSCNGCHESESTAAVNRNSIAIRREASEIQSWRGPARGFSFKREIQPVLDRYCVGCHDGRREFGGKMLADLRADQGKMIAYRNGKPVAEVITGPITEEVFKKYGGVFEPSYIELRRYLRVAGIESDLRGLNPGEFQVNTTELIQMLEKGHYGVSMDAEAWDRLVTWIDLNAPDHGTWRETAGVDRTNPYHRRRQELAALYGGARRADPEVIPEVPQVSVQPILPPILQKPSPIQAVAFAMQNIPKRIPGEIKTRTIDLGGGTKLEMVLIPEGSFVMGDVNGNNDEKPVTAVKIERPFWMGRFELTNEQYAKFDPKHDSRYQHKGSWKFNEWDLGWPENAPAQPVIRISQKGALAFCAWLSQRIGEKVTLPTEAQWEYAARAGSETPLFYGGLDTDFSKYANLADYNIRDLVYDVRDQYPPDLVPRDPRFNDGKLVTAKVGSYLPNAWGLHDMIGNVWEWTRSAYRSYPYSESDGRNEPRADEKVVARGGSWYDRPQRARSAFRLNYPAWQKIYNVGFRVVIEERSSPKMVARENR